MIHGTHWTPDRVARAVCIEAPPGYRILGCLEVLQEGDLQGSEKGWTPLHPANLGSRAGAIISAARAGRGVTHDWVVMPRPEDFLQITAIDRQALEQIARNGHLDVIPSSFWECTDCGHVYPKGASHRCGTPQEGN